VSRESGHPSDEIQDLLDGRLDPTARVRVEAHLEGCPQCRREREAIARVKRAAASALSSRETPNGLAASAIALLDREDRERASRAQQLRRPRSRVPHFAYVAGAVAALIALIVFFARPRDLPSQVAGDYARFRAGELPLEIETDDPGELTRFFADRGVRFPTRVLDLRMMGYRLAGGRVLTDGRRKRAFFVYRGEGNKILACQMYEGDVRDLSGAPEIRRHGDFTFLVYRAKNQTQVFWQEGKVACVLVSDIPSEEVVQLAFAKAMKV
jgi:anti-sigma factor RsiW